MLLVPSVSAQGRSGRASNICSSQPQLKASIIDRLNEKSASYEEAHQTQQLRQTERRLEQVTKFTKARAKADIKRSDSYKLIEEKQETAEQKAMAQEFAIEVDAAVDARRQAYDAARAEFRATIDSLLAERNQEIRGAATELKTRAESLLKSIGSSCRAGRENATIRTELKNGLREARLGYAEKMRDRKDFAKAVRDAAAKRQAAYSEAKLIFQQTMQNIREKYADLR